MLALFRALLQTSEPEKNGDDSDHSAIVGSALLVSSGDPAELLQPIDEPLDAVALTIRFPVEVGLARFTLALVGMTAPMPRRRNAWRILALL